MRSKFSELIDQGIASFEYTPLVGETPEQDPICRAYNNIFSIPTDTHMSCLDDMTRIISGHIIATPEWRKFVYSPNWGAVNFCTAGYCNLAEFLFQNGLQGEVGSFNNDVVFFVTPIEFDEINTSMPVAIKTNESKIPLSPSVITKSGNIGHVLECFGHNISETVKKLNESSWIKGTNWVPFGNDIVGLVGNTTYVIENVK
jgi:hypothetical protein